MREAVEGRRGASFMALAASLAVGGVLLAGCAQQSGAQPGGDGATTAAAEPAEPSEPSAEPAPMPELPGGGYEIFPDYRLVGYSGVRYDPAADMGRLTGDLDDACKEIKQVGKQYEYGKKIMPVFEFIPVVVHGSPQNDGSYRTRVKPKEVQYYLDAARRCGALLLLNIQPGRSEFMPEMKFYEEFLKQPDVGVALDPEWAMDPGEVPGVNLGRTDGPELNEAAEYLSELVVANNLPEKVMVFHQFNEAAVEKMRGLKPHEGVVEIRSIDGLGGPEAKTEKYNALVKKQPPWIYPGFKLFYKEDADTSAWGSRVMTPKEVMKLKPRPDYVLYE